MSRGRAAREPGVVPPGQHRSPSGPQASLRRWGRGIRGRQGRQRPIRSTLTVLLIIPVVSLIALWAYAASTTVGGAIAKRNADTVNKDIGAPTQALFTQLTQERALTFVWQSVHGRMPRTGLDAQRTHTDAAVAAFRTAAATASSAETPTARSAVAAMLGELGQLPRIRAAVDAGTLQPLATFQDYNNIVNASFPFSLGALANPDASIPFFEQSEGVGDEAQALEYVGREAALMGGALVTGGRMSEAEHELFVQSVDNERFLQQVGGDPAVLAADPDPYLQVFASPAYTNFRALENRVVATSPGARIR